MKRAFSRLSAATTLVALSATLSAYEVKPMNDKLTAEAKAHWVLENLGPQITRATVMSTAVAPGDANTSGTVYFSLMGEPGHLVAANLESAEVLKTLPMPGAQGSYGMRVFSDGNLYLSSHSSGNLFRYKPGSDEVEHLGKPVDDVTFIWDVVEGEPGKLYGACYPSAIVFEYDIATGKTRSFGSIKDGEDYARSIAWDAGTKKLYIGVGSHADIIELDPATGEKRSVLPKEYKSTTFVYSIGVTRGHVLARVDPGNKVAVIDAATSKQIAEMPSFTGSLVSPPDADGIVYFSGGGTLHRYNPNTRSGEDTKYEIRGEARGFAWGKDKDGNPELLIGTTGRNIQRFNPKTGKGERAFIPAPELPLHIQNITGGKDGLIYSSGYVSGQLAILNPNTGERKQYGGVKQAEGMTWYNDKLYLGTYPGANLSVYDTSQPGGTATNPATGFSLKDEGQDRPFGMLGVPEEGKIFMGTVPGYGLLEGALTVIDAETSQPEMHKNIIPNQGVVTFAYKDGILYAGSTIYGGLGIDSTEKEAVLFEWDIKASKIRKQLVPVKERRCISGLRFAPDGTLWGWADGTLFIYDTDKQEVVYTHDEFDATKMFRHQWRGNSMSVPINGKFYGCAYGKIFELDIETKKLTVLAGGGFEVITSTPDGTVFAVNKDNLVRLRKQ